MKKIKIIIIALLIIVVVGISGAFYMYNDGLKAASKESQEVIVEIAGGQNQVLAQLDEAGLIKNEFMASLHLKLNDYEFIANTYVLDKNMDFDTICQILEGDQKYVSSVSFTVIEGQSIPEYATSLSNALGITQEEVLAKWTNKEYLEQLVDQYWFLDREIIDDGLMFPLEGYLAPNTYSLSESDLTVEAATTLMLDQMEIVLEPYRDEMATFTIDGEVLSTHEFLTFASIVQSESLFEEDHSKIAGVFVHRLENDIDGTNQLLQSDVTVNYANQVTKVAVTYSDLEVDSKYNTYKYPGLPIGPISSVTPAIIEATLNYEETDNLFFFAIQGGEVIYTKTYQEHLDEIEIAKEAGLWLED